MKHRSLRKLLLTSSLLLALGCGGAFGQAMKRGDQFMQTGQWDLAAAEYERAVHLKPGDEKAQQALQRARASQAQARVTEARALLAKSDAEGALVLLQEAVELDPNNPDAPKLLGEATGLVLDRAEVMLDNDDLDGAFRLTTLALRGAPDDPRARSLDGQARDGLAQRSFEAAAKLEADGKLGAALAELGAATEYVPGYRDTEPRIARLSAELKRQVIYHAVVGRFVGDPKSRAIADELSRSALDSAFGQGVLIEVSKQAPLPGQGFVGIRLDGTLSKYAFEQRKSTTPRSCSYVCGTVVQTNSSHTELKTELTRAERDHQVAEQEVGKLTATVAGAERTYDDVARDVDRAQLEVDRARLDLERCQQANPTNEALCAPEQRRLEQELTRLGASQARAERPATVLAEARANLDAATIRRDRAAALVASYQAALQGTPATVEVQRTCEHRYVVTNHDVDASVSLTLRAEELRDRTVVFDDITTSFREADRDSTFPPMPGRCDAVAVGDPLELKNESEIKKDLAGRASAYLAKQIRAQYDTYRRSYLDRARRQGRAGVVDEAVDAYLRYLLTTPKQTAQQEVKEARAFIQDGKHIGPATLDRLL